MSWLEKPGALAALRTTRTNVDIAKEFGTSEKSVRRAKKAQGITATVAPAASGETSEDSSGAKSVTAVRTRPITLQDARDWITATGDNPDDYTLSIRSIAYGEGLFSNRMSAVPKRGTETVATHDLDPVGILASLRKFAGLSTRVKTDPNSGESTFVLSINDIQLGQSYNGGSPATIAQFHEFIALAVERITELRNIGRRLERIVIICGGDLVEGCFIYPHQMRSLDLNRKQQQQGVIALLLHALDTLAPMFDRVTVLASKGNHGEHREGGKKIDLSDNDDTLVVEMAKLALARDSSMQHIDWIIANEEAAVWAPVYDWTLVTTHGDIYAKGVSGATTERKAHAWIKNMAAAFRKFGRIGRADVLITHHFHHDEMADWGDTLWRQTTSQDRGSPEFSQATGQYSEPGMLTGVMTPSSRWQDEAVLR